jgi:molybdate transport system regulatory protein
MHRMTRIKSLELAGALGHVPADKRVEILRRVGQVGSISQAARDAGVSYKAAWQALDTLSNLAGSALVERAVGGAGGGGARLTRAGEQLLQAADALATARDQVLARLGGKRQQAQGFAGLGLRTSMRNQLPCTVGALRSSGGAVRARLRLAGGQDLAARITRESAQLLGLHAGQPVLALCKAMAVQVGAEPAQTEGGNLLEGVVARAVPHGAGEIVLTLEGGQQLVGFAAAGHGLRRGAATWACVSETAVVIALP